MTSYLSPYIQESALIDSKYTDNYILTIQYTLGGLSFTIFDNIDHRYICLKHYTISDKDISLNTLLAELQERESWQLERFYQVNLVLDDSRNTLIPAEYHNEQISKQYLEALQFPSSNIGTDNIGNGICNIYSVDDEIAEIAKAINKNLCLRHASTIFLNTLIREFSERTAETRAFVNVKNNCYELAILENDKIIFHNYFNFNTKEDFLYFILFTFEQLKIDNETTPLYFMGFIENNSSIINLCSRYIRNIRFINRNNNLKFANELNTIPYYYYYTLYNSVSCE